MIERAGQFSRLVFARLQRRFEFSVNGRSTGPKVCLGRRYLGPDTWNFSYSSQGFQHVSAKILFNTWTSEIDGKNLALVKICSLYQPSDWLDVGRPSLFGLWLDVIGVISDHGDLPPVSGKGSYVLDLALACICCIFCHLRMLHGWACFFLLFSWMLPCRVQEVWASIKWTPLLEPFWGDWPAHAS